MIVIVAGVSGSGKTTVGALLAGAGLAIRRRRRFAPGCEHREDAGRDPAHRLRSLALAAGHRGLDGRAHRAGRAAVVGCSALKRSYRDLLLDGRPGVRMVFLAVDREVLARRLAARRDHFFPGQLLGTQFDALEPPQPGERVLSVVPAGEPAATVDSIIALLFPVEGHEAET